MDVSPGAAVDPQIARRMERLPLSGWHRRLTVIVGVGAFYEYFEVFAGSVLAAVLRGPWRLTTPETALLIGSVFFGMFVGALTLGRLADHVGRRRMFLVNLSIYLLFSLLAAASPNVWVLIACRFAAGIGAGAEAALIPTYLGEFLPRRHRGRYTGFALAMGISAFPVVALVGAPLARAHWLVDGWRWLLVIGASGVLAVLWMRRRMPESPRWLLAHGEPDRAERELERIERDVEASLGAPLPPVEPVAAVVPTGGDLRFVGDLPGPELHRRMLAIGSLFTFGVLGYYGFSSLVPAILVAKGFDVTTSLLYTAVVAVGYPLGAIAVALVAEVWERKRLVIAATAATAVFGLAFGFADAEAVILVVGFLLGVAANLHSNSASIYMGEVFPTRSRSTMIGICYGIGRLAAGALPFLGLPILAAFGPIGVLSASAACMVVACVCVATFGPRTTGRSLEEATETAAVPVPEGRSAPAR